MPGVFRFLSSSSSTSTSITPPSSSHPQAHADLAVRAARGSRVSIITANSDKNSTYAASTPSSPTSTGGGYHSFFGLRGGNSSSSEHGRKNVWKPGKTSPDQPVFDNGKSIASKSRTGKYAKPARVVDLEASYQPILPAGPIYFLSHTSSTTSKPRDVREKKHKSPKSSSGGSLTSLVGTIRRSKSNINDPNSTNSPSPDLLAPPALIEQKVRKSTDTGRFRNEPSASTSWLPSLTSSPRGHRRNQSTGSTNSTIPKSSLSVVVDGHNCPSSASPELPAPVLEESDFIETIFELPTSSNETPTLPASIPSPTIRFSKDDFWNDPFRRPTSPPPPQRKFYSDDNNLGIGPTEIFYNINMSGRITAQRRTVRPDNSTSGTAELPAPQMPRPHPSSVTMLNSGGRTRRKIQSKDNPGDHLDRDSSKQTQSAADIFAAKLAGKLGKKSSTKSSQTLTPPSTASSSSSATLISAAVPNPLKAQFSSQPATPSTNNSTPRTRSASSTPHHTCARAPNPNDPRIRSKSLPHNSSAPPRKSSIPPPPPSPATILTYSHRPLPSIPPAKTHRKLPSSDTTTAADLAAWAETMFPVTAPPPSYASSNTAASFNRFRISSALPPPDAYLNIPISPQLSTIGELPTPPVTARNSRCVSGEIGGVGEEGGTGFRHPIPHVEALRKLRVGAHSPTIGVEALLGCGCDDGTKESRLDVEEEVERFLASGLLGQEVDSGLPENLDFLREGSEDDEQKGGVEEYFQGREWEPLKVGGKGKEGSVKLGTVNEGKADAQKYKNMMDMEKKEVMERWEREKRRAAMRVEEDRGDVY